MKPLQLLKHVSVNLLNVSWRSLVCYSWLVACLLPTTLYLLYKWIAGKTAAVLGCVFTVVSDALWWSLVYLCCPACDCGELWCKYYTDSNLLYSHDKPLPSHQTVRQTEELCFLSIPFLSVMAIFMHVSRSSQDHEYCSVLNKQINKPNN